LSLETSPPYLEADNKTNETSHWDTTWFLSNIN
jgi:hypothetical protein